jgi:hypothetical protein
MANIKAAVVVSCLLGFSPIAGCASGPVAKGAMIGALSGAVVGTTTGLLVSNEDLLGSKTDERSGNLALKKGPTIGAGAIVGVVFGAVVGAMIGHGYDDGSNDGPGSQPPAASNARPAAF